MAHDLTSHPPQGGGPTSPSTAQLECEAGGGTWDAETKTCKTLEDAARERDVRVAQALQEEGKGRTITRQVPPRKPAPTATPTKPEILRDEKTGEISGVTLPSGETFTGINKADVISLLEKEQRKELPEGTEEFGTAAAAAEIERRQEELQATGQPVRRELDPTLGKFEDIPVLGPLLVKIAKVLDEAGFGTKDTILGKAIGGEGTNFFELQPEELRTIALTTIEKNEIEKGLTNSEKFGSFVEALGLGGLSNFAAEKPSENIQTILRRVKIAKTRATNAEIKVKDGTWRQAYGEEVVTGIENDLQAMESRIKLLLQESPEFKFDSDGVNFIEDKIFEARERLFSARINMLSGEAKDPSEIQILIALQESIQAEDFEI